MRIENMKKFFPLALAPVSLLATNVMAADYSAIEDAVDWASVATAVIGVLAAGAVVIVSFKGGQFLLRAIRGV